MVKDIITHIVSIYYDSFGDIIVIIITWGCIKKLHTNLQVTLIKDYQVSLFCRRVEIPTDYKNFSCFVYPIRGADPSRHWHN